MVVREYMDEVKTEHSSWLQMPRRMLRHRAIQQCARLAFGISCAEYKPGKTFSEKVRAGLDRTSMNITSQARDQDLCDRAQVKRQVIPRITELKDKLKVQSGTNGH